MPRHVAEGATDKAAKYKERGANFAARTTYENAMRAAKEAIKAARDETKKANVMAKGAKSS
jgi:hypothetical protein